VFRTGLPGESAKYSVTYMGTIENLLAGEQTIGASEGYNRATAEHFAEYQRRLEEYPEDPVVFVIGQYYLGRCNGGVCAEDDPATEVNEKDESEEALFTAALEAGNAVEVGPDVYVLTGDGRWTPPQDVVDAAHQAASAEAARFEDHPPAWANPLHTLRVLAALFVLVVLPGLLAMRFFRIDDSFVAKVALIPGISIVLTLLSGIAVLTFWRGPLSTTKGFVMAGVSVGIGLVLRLAGERVLSPLRSFTGFFDKLFSQFSNLDFSVLMGMQFLAQAGQGVVQGAIAKSLAFGGEQGFDVQNLPSAQYLLTVVLFLYGPYTLISPFIGVAIDRFPRRSVVWTATIVAAIMVSGVAVIAMMPLAADETTEGNTFATAALILGLLAVQALVRVVLAVKSAAIPDVLSGKDLLQGNSISQAGGGFFQLVGIAVGGIAAAIVPPFIAVLVGAVVIMVGGIVARRLHHVEAAPHENSFGAELAKVFRTIGAGIREVAGRAPAAMGLSSFQMLRYQFWGFNLFTFGLYAKNLVETGDAEGLSLAISGAGGLLGAALGIVVAQKAKDRVPPSRLLIIAMVVMGSGTIVGGLLVSVAGFALMLFTGFFAFFLGKVSADTVVQQAMPDDFRGRAFALFDIAYNLGFIIPAFILYLVWSDSEEAVRTILLVSGAVFLVLTALIAGWIKRMHDQLAPQDDLVELPDIAPSSTG
jgi:MFS family permease